MDFVGTHEHTLDAKNRLTVPAGYRDAFAGGLYLVIGSEGCLELWRPEDHKAFVAEVLAAFPRNSPEARRLRRQYHGSAHPTELDKVGRIGIPPRHLAAAKLSKDVKLVGVGEYVELWDGAEWERTAEDLPGQVSQIEQWAHEGGA